MRKLTLMVALGTFAMTTLSGCGSSGFKYPGTPISPATLTITATSGAITHTTTFTISVTR